MSKERFDHLLDLVKDKISKKNTNMREAITAEERLVITLRYLSAGMSQQTLCYSFRIGRTTVSQIVNEVCTFIRNSFIRNEDIKNSKALVTSEDRSFIHLHIIQRRKCPKCSKCSEIIKPS